MAYKTKFKIFWNTITSDNAQGIYTLLGMAALVIGIIWGAFVLFEDTPEDIERYEYFENMQRINDSLDVVIAKHKQKKQAKLDSINGLEKRKQDSITNYLFVNRDSLQNYSAKKSLTDYGLKVSKLRCQVLGRSATQTKCQYVHNKKLYLTDCKIVSMGTVDCVPGLFNTSVKNDFKF